MTWKIKISTISDIIIFLFFCNILGDALNLMLFNIILLLSIGCILIKNIGNYIKSVFSLYGIWLLTFSLIIFASSFWALSQSSAMNMAKTFIKVAFMSIYIYCETDTFEKLLLRINQFLAATVFMMAKVMIAYFTSNDRLDAFTQGAGLHFNTVAQILAFSIILSFWFIINQKNNKNNIRRMIYIYYSYILLAFLMIIWSGSRKSIMIPIIGIACVILVGKFELKSRFRYIAFGLLIGFVVVYSVMSNDVLSNRFSDLFDTLLYSSDSDVSAIERQYYRDTAWHLFLNKPLLGWGADGFMEYLDRIRYSHVAYCHNNMLEILSSFGIIGFGLYYWFYFFLLIRLFMVKEKYFNMGTILFTVILVLLIFEYGIVTYYFSIYHVLFCFAAIFLKFNNKKLKREI